MVEIRGRLLALTPCLLPGSIGAFMLAVAIAAYPVTGRVLVTGIAATICGLITCFFFALTLRAIEVEGRRLVFRRWIGSHGLPDASLALIDIRWRGSGEHRSLEVIERKSASKHDGHVIGRCEEVVGGPAALEKALRWPASTPSRTRFLRACKRSKEQVENSGDATSRGFHRGAPADTSRRTS
ncbi:MAG: hypothetical protein AAGG07_03270 [Planctomycetota bacterium]